MGLFSTSFNSLEELYWEQIADLYDAENRITEALPKMIEKAKNPELRSAFQHHLSETKQQVQRLEQVFKKHGKSPERETCQAMKGLISEGEEVLKASGDDDVLDAALIAAAQRVEHYEMAGYGTVRNFAERLGYHDDAALLQKTLDEEGAADHKLTRVAESSINVRAAAHA